MYNRGQSDKYIHVDGHKANQGGGVMQQIEHPAQNSAFHFEGLLRFFGVFRMFGLSVHPEHREAVESAFDEQLRPTPRCECGGYNEAFIVQHWANYDPIR